jgi:hypothetical protein
LRRLCAIAVQKEVKAQNKKAFIAVLAISGKTSALTLKATVQYSRFHPENFGLFGSRGIVK